MGVELWGRNVASFDSLDLRFDSEGSIDLQGVLVGLLNNQMRCCNSGEQEMAAGGFLARFLAAGNSPVELIVVSSSDRNRARGHGVWVTITEQQTIEPNTLNAIEG
ncbi:unnamed protein product [Lactuca saligna]|uniref:Uncharacterized protein n=1 Tax=Lactuca saligna TaxID=75948 RepID=A0AA35YZS1_LACSI|nr:unnamed protein product [Lactuca saligna]